MISPVYSSGVMIFTEAIGSNNTGFASKNPFLNACLAATLNAISEESTG